MAKEEKTRSKAEMQKFEGATTAVITPMHEDGSIDRDGLNKLTEFNIKSGIHNIVACGTTGQSPTLTHLEWHGIVSNSKYYSRKAEQETGRKVHVIAGAGTNNFEKSKELTQLAESLGADATLHVTGYYNMPLQLGMRDYFSFCVAASELPLIMYDVPARGHPTIKPETRIAAALLNPGKIIGVKDATGGEYIKNGEKHNMWAETVRLARENNLDKHKFKLISGDDPKTYEIMSQYDGVGVISVTSNIFPQAVSRMVELLLEGKNAEAKSIDDALAPFNSVLKVKGISYNLTAELNMELMAEDDSFANPAPVQYAAYVLGMIGSDRLRNPLIPLSDKRIPSEARMQVLNALEQMYHSNPELFKPIEEFYGKDVGARLKLMHEI